MKEKKKIKINNKMIFYLLIVAVISVIFLYMYQTVTVDLLMKDLHSLEQQKQQLLSDTSRLEGQVERLSNIDRISNLASKRYHMITNSDKIYLLKIGGYKSLEKAKKEFARRFRKNHKKINLAGVQ